MRLVELPQKVNKEEVLGETVVTKMKTIVPLEHYIGIGSSRYEELFADG